MVQVPYRRETRLVNLGKDQLSDPQSQRPSPVAIRQGARDVYDELCPAAFWLAKFSHGSPNYPSLMAECLIEAGREFWGSDCTVADCAAAQGVRPGRVHQRHRLFFIQRVPHFPGNEPFRELSPNFGGGKGQAAAA